MKTTFALGCSLFICAAWARMGESTGARQRSVSGKYFCISRFTDGQQEETITSCLPSRSMRSYSCLTSVAPCAVSSAPEKPSASSARRTASKETPQCATNDGATLA